MKKYSVYVNLVSLLSLFLAGCMPLLDFPFSRSSTKTAPSSPILTISPTNFPSETKISPTITPTQIFDPTPTKIPPIVRTWGDYPGPTIFPPIEIPPPMPLLDKPTSQTNILLLGDDQRPYESGLRTDGIMLVSINTEKKIVNLLSFPRDLYVYAPGWTMQRINVIYQRGGFELLSLTFAYNFGIQLDYYMRVNIFTLEKLIDQLGGIDVEVAYPMSDYDPLLRSNRSIPAGNIHMNGATAIWYCRARTKTNDFDRNRRQQEVFLALAKRIFSTDVIKQAPDLYHNFATMVSTNMTFENVVQFIPFIINNKDNLSIRQYLIGKTFVKEWTVPSDGSKVLLPKRDPIRLLMLQALES